MSQSAISYFADMVASTIAAAALLIYALTHFAAVEFMEWVLLAIVGVVISKFDCVLHTPQIA
jgi:hypothetical protein